MKTSALSLLKWIAGIVVGAWLGQYLLAMALPSLVMQTLYNVGSQDSGVNTLTTRLETDATSRQVVRPSPDLLYAICFYDLSEGPITVPAPVPARYWSLQFYQMNTDNFAGITNQREQAYRIGSTAEVMLVSDGQNAPEFAGEVFTSPTTRGVMLLRASAIGDSLESRQAMAASSCRPA